MADPFDYSDRYYDDEYEYRHVTLPKAYVNRIPVSRLMKEAEWRSLGVCQSAGWMHYAIHKPERHILLFKRPKNYSTLPSHAKTRWAKKAMALMATRNAEMARSDSTRQRYSRRPVLRDNNAGTHPAGNENEPVGVTQDLFY